MERIKDVPVRSAASRSTNAQSIAAWEGIATSIDVIPKPAIQSEDSDTPDNRDLETIEVVAPVRVPVPANTPMVYDQKSDTYFPISINLPGVGQGGQTVPAAPPVDEKLDRKNLIIIFAAILAILLIALFIMRKKG